MFVNTDTTFQEDVLSLASVYTWLKQAGVLFTTDRLRAVDARANRLKEQYEDVQR